MTRDELLKRFPNASESFIQKNTAPDISKIAERYQELRNVHKVGAEFGMTGDAVWKLLKRNGVKLFNTDWCFEEEKLLAELYQQDLSLGEIGSRLGRTKFAVCIKARKMGITSYKTPKPWKSTSREAYSEKMRLIEVPPEVRQERSRFMKEWLKTHPHPRGMAGKHHNQATKDIISKTHKGRKVPREVILKGLKTREKNGTLLKFRPHTTWKQGWVDIGGKKFFSRSSWEIRYAKYLEWLKRNNQIIDWNYETETFWFPVKRGVTNYTPDFMVVNTDGTKSFHEVKGWMDAKSKTKLRRMAIHHRNVNMVVAGADWFKQNRELLNLVEKTI